MERERERERDVHACLTKSKSVSWFINKLATKSIQWKFETNRRKSNKFLSFLTGELSDIPTELSISRGI
jgi:hypothetical protein